MRKVLLYILCLTLFFSNSVSVYAQEESSEIVENSLNENDGQKQNLEEEEIQQENDLFKLTSEKKEGSIVETENEISELEQNDKSSGRNQEQQILLIDENEDDTVNIILDEIVPANDDPQYGRENGNIDINFYGEQKLSEDDESYTHADKFSNYTINDVIDVSYYQGEIDWELVKESGINYAFIRVGFRGYGESGSLNEDINFSKNMQNAIEAGLKVGVYFFSQAITENEAIDEANYVLNLIDGYQIDLPLVIDFEYASSASGLTGRLYNANLSKDATTRICKQFCNTVENAGYTAMLYANKDMLENGLNASEISMNYKIWLANYTTCTSYQGTYDFWQYTQSGTVEGISGKVDKNFWYEKPEKVYGEVQEGIYTISTCLNEDKVIDIPGASVLNGTNAIIYENNGKWNQKFYIRPEAEDTYIIMSVNSGKVLEVNDNDICQNVYTGEATQQWRFIVNSDGSYTIEAYVQGMVLDVAGGSAKNETKIVLYESKDVIWQKFRLNPENVCSLKDGIYTIESAMKENKVLKLNSDNRSLEISTLEVTDKQKFQLEYLGNGCYRIISLLEDNVLTSVGDNLLCFNELSNASKAQQWILKQSANDTYTIISAKDGKCIENKADDLLNGMSLMLGTINAKLNQQYKMYETKSGEEVLEAGIYTIHSALDNTKVLDIDGGSKKSDANIHLYSLGEKAWQQFEIRPLENGNYSIHSYHSGMAVTVKDSKDIDGTNVYQYFPTGGKYQEWKIIPTGKGYYKIVSALGNKVLDVEGGNAKNLTNIIIYQEKGKNNQRFSFEKVGDIDENISRDKVLEDGTYTICTSLDESKVLDVEDSSLYSGANIILYAAKNGTNQQFVFQRDQESGLYTITSKKSGIKMTYKDGILENGVNVYQDNIFEDNGKKWKLVHIIDDYYTVYASDSDYCLDVTGKKTINGTNIEIYKDNKGKAQIFKLKRINNQTTTEQNVEKKLEEGLYIISSGQDSKMVLDVASASKEDGANILLYQNNGQSNQKFIVKCLENGNYIIKALHSGKLLTVNETNVCQETDQELLSQQWCLYYVGNETYALKIAQSDKVLDITGGISKNNANIAVYTSKNVAWQRFKFVPTTTIPNAKFVLNSDNSYTISYEVYTKGNESSADDKYYLMLADSYTGKIYGSPLTSVEKNFEVLVNLSVSDRSKLKEISMNKLVLAVKQSNGTYKAINTPVLIANPEEIAKNKTAIFKASSKKGLQGVAYASNGSMPVDARYANTKQTLLNLDIADVVNPESDYTTFVYKGKTYNFSKCSDLVANVKSMNAGYEQYLYGNNGTTKVAVSLCLLLSYDSANSFLIDPAARSKGHRYYTLNVREEKARETLEALFVYLGELFGQEDCYVTNWILGNEINSSKAWNYQGSLNFDNYMTCYATAFCMLYNAVKTEKTGNTISISLDNGWTAAPDTYAGKTTLDSFAKKINDLNPNIEWSISYHPYSYPLTRADFWNDSSNTTSSTSTKYISMKNITVLTNYAASLEKTYKMDIGSIRVLLTEQGYSYGAGAEKQAQAIARGYYIAEFNNRIDAFIIRAIVDDAEEAKGKLYFGLMNSQQDKRIAFYVYEFMDSDLSKLKNTAAPSVVTSANYSKFNSAKSILCNTNWKAIVPGFSELKLAEIK